MNRLLFAAVVLSVSTLAVASDQWAQDPCIKPESICYQDKDKVRWCREAFKEDQVCPSTTDMLVQSERAIGYFEVTRLNLRALKRRSLNDCHQDSLAELLSDHNDAVFDSITLAAALTDRCGG